MVKRVSSSGSSGIIILIIIIIIIIILISFLFKGKLWLLVFGCFF